MSGEKRIHYAWFILIGCCALTATMGCVSYVIGQYLTPIATDFGVGLGQLAVMLTFFSIAQAIAAPFVGQLIARVNINLLLSVAEIVVCACLVLFSFSQEVWQFYLIGAVMGLGAAFCFIIPAPILIGNWFSKKTGFAVGIAMAGAGVVGMIMNPVIASLIPSLGWRMTFIVNAVIIAVITLPFTLFVLKLKPEDKNLKPYGYEEVETDATAEGATTIDTYVPSSRAMKSLPFFMMFVVFLVCGFGATYATYLAPFATSLGVSAAFIGMIASANSFGNMFSKIIFGFVADKFGPVVLNFLGFGLTAVGFILLLVCNGNMAIALAGAILLGCVNAMGSVGNPMFVRSIFGNKDFGKIFSTLQMGITIAGAAAPVIIGFLFDFTMSYQIAFMIGLALVIIAILLVAASLSMGKKIEREAV